MGISRSIIDEIRTKTSIVSLLEEKYAVNLRGYGNVSKAVCPLPEHDERTPSFTVYEDEGRYKCYGCQAHGDVFDLVREMEGCSFPEAVVALGEFVGVHIEYDKQEETPSKTLRDALKRAEELFSSTPHPLVTSFIEERKFNEAHLRQRWGLGYSSAQCFNQLMQEFGADLLIEAGLMRRQENGRITPFFTPRLIWPIRDTLGRTVAFSARRIHDDDFMSAKFINSSTTSVYVKSKVLFGFDVARREIRKRKQALICEGPMDVAAFHDAGVEIAVAALGTAFTAEHAKLLSNAVGAEGEIIVALDSDGAGNKATRAIIPLLTAHPARLTAVVLPNGDPEEYRREHGPQALQKVLEGRVPLLERVLSIYIDPVDFSHPDEVAHAGRAVQEILATVQDVGLRISYTRWSEGRLMVPIQPETTNAPPASTIVAPPFEFHAIRLAYECPSVFQDWREKLGDLELYANPQIRDAVQKLLTIDPALSSQEWRDKALAILPNHFTQELRKGFALNNEEEGGTFAQQLAIELGERKKKRDNTHHYDNAQTAFNRLFTKEGNNE